MIKTTGPNVIRLFCLSSHYSKPLDYTENIILELKNKWRQIANAYHELEFRIRNKITTDKNNLTPNQADMELSQYFEDFEKELENDLNFSIAMTSFFKFINKLNQILSMNNNLSMTFLDNSFNILEKFLNIIGLEMSRIDEKERSEIEKEIIKRNQFRKDKKYEESDRVRFQLENKYNIDLIDHKNYTFWKKKTVDDI